MPRLSALDAAARRRTAGGDTAPIAIDESELARMAQVAARLLAGRPLLSPGHQPAPRRAGQGSEFLEHRDYAPGDDPRRIDWRASARTREVQVRRYRDEASADWFVCVDTSASMRSAGGAKWRLAQQLAYAFCYTLLALGQRVGIIAFAAGPVSVLPAGRGRHQLARLLAELTALAPRTAGGTTSLAAVEAQLGPRDPICVLSDFLRADALRPELARLAHGGREVHALMIGAAADVTVDTATTVADMESGERVDLRAGAHAAPAAWRALRDELRAYCRSREIVFSVCDAGERWRDVVLRHLRTANRQIG
jgi:uncharacterized protein (DUF58 family)